MNKNLYERRGDQEVDICGKNISHRKEPDPISDKGCCVF